MLLFGCVYGVAMAFVLCLGYVICGMEVRMNVPHWKKPRRYYACLTALCIG